MFGYKKEEISDGRLLLDCFWQWEVFTVQTMTLDPEQTFLSIVFFSQSYYTLTFCCFCVAVLQSLFLLCTSIKGNADNNVKLSLIIQFTVAAASC